MFLGKIKWGCIDRAKHPTCHTWSVSYMVGVIPK